MEQPQFESLCRRSCCPEVAFDRAPTAEWAAMLIERGGEGSRRPAARLCLTRNEAIELARLLDREGFVEEARRSTGT